MTTSSPESSSVVDDVAQAAAVDSPVRVSRSIMVGNVADDNDDDGSFLDVSQSNSSNAATRGSTSMQVNTTIDDDGFDDDAQSASSKKSARAKSSSFNMENLFKESVADAGLNAYGCVFIEVWIMLPDGTALIRVEPGGHWMDPSFTNSLPTEELQEQARELDRYARNSPPGAGLAGTLYEQAASSSTRRVYWRQIKAMLNDPFVQRGSGERMKRLSQLGIGLVGSVKFSFQNTSGIVCFFSRSGANMDILRSSMNEGFLIGSTDLIGANYAITKNREECAAMRRELFRQAIEKVKREFRKSQQPNLGSLVRSQSTIIALREARDAAQSPIADEDVVAKMKKKIIKFGKWTWKRINNSRKKWRGAKMHGPPRQSYMDCAGVTFGVFFTMLTVLKIANTLNNSADPEFKLEGGWYASSLCIIFALTPAPVGQPRQIFAAHLWNALVGLAIRQIPTGTTDFMEWDRLTNPNSYGLPLLWKQALAVSIGVSGQAKLGILHPPATGLSYAFVSSNKYSWGTIVSVYLADAVVVGLAMLMLNLSNKKQYPLYWLGFGWEDTGGTIGSVHAKVKSAKTLFSPRSMKVKGDDNNV